jgi:hypothetical protein
MGLLLLGGDEAHGALIKAQRRLLALDISKKAVFVTLPGQRGDFFQGLRTCCDGALPTYSHLQRCGAALAVPIRDGGSTRLAVWRKGV